MKNVEKFDDAIVFQNRFYEMATGRLTSPIETQNYVIVQVTESYYNRGFNIGGHLQYCDLEITLALSDELYCSANGAKEKLNKRDVYLSFKGENHALYSNKSCRFQTLALNFKSENPMHKRLIAKYGEKRKLCGVEIVEPFSKIIAEFANLGAPFYLNSLESLITGILVNLARSGEGEINPVNLKSQEKMPMLINYIDAHFLEIDSLSKLSSDFGYSYSHLSKCFKRIYGRNISEYLNQKRLEYSVELLKKGKNLTEIAEKLGFSSAYNFSRAFKNFYGVSPTNYKIK